MKPVSYLTPYPIVDLGAGVDSSRKGEILEGAEDDIRATYYILAFQREFNDAEAELRWKVVDMMVVGGKGSAGLFHGVIKAV